MTLQEITKAVQKAVGTTPDGVWGVETASAVMARLVGEKLPEHHLKRIEAFWPLTRAVTGKLNQAQVDSINAILRAASHWPDTWVAYALATAWHEARFEPVAEIGKGRGKSYGKLGKYGQAQYGRGLVQLTWDRNYEWADKALGLNGALLANFDKALEPDIAVAILVKGMEEGAFTGKALADYSNFNAMRAVINGSDKAALIAEYAIDFLDALKAGQWS